MIFANSFHILPRTLISFILFSLTIYLQSILNTTFLSPLPHSSSSRASRSFAGLFSRVILQSGTALCPWALGGAHKQVADYTARLVGCSSDLGAHHLLQCLQAVPAGKLVHTIAEYFVGLLGFIMCVCVAACV